MPKYSLVYLALFLIGFLMPHAYVPYMLCVCGGAVIGALFMFFCVGRDEK